MKVVHKFFLKIFILFAGLIGIFYYGSAKLSSIDENIKAAFIKNNYNFDYQAKKTSFRLLRNRIVLTEVEIKSISSEDISNMKIDEVVFNIDLMSLLFQGRVANDIILHNPSLNFYHVNKNKSNDKNVFIELQKLVGTKIYVKYGRITSYNQKLMIEKEINEINGEINCRNNSINLDLHAKDNDLDFHITSNVLSISNNRYSIDGNLMNDKDKLWYKLDLELNNNGISQLSGKLDAEGNDLKRLTNIFCLKCNDEKVYDPENEFKLSTKINFDKDKKLIKFDDIEFVNNGNKFNSIASYDIASNRLNLNVKSDGVKIFSDSKNLNILSFKDRVVNGKSNALGDLISYFKILNNFNFNVNFFINELEFFGKMISNFEGNIVSNDGKIAINKLIGVFDGKNNIDAYGVVFGNEVRNKIEIKVNVPLENNNSVYFVFSFMPGIIAFNDVKIKYDDAFVSGDLLFRRNDEANDFGGNLVINGTNLESLYKITYNIVYGSEDNAERNGILSDILVILNKMNISTNIKLVLINSKINKDVVKNTKFVFLIDDKRAVVKSQIKDPFLADIENIMQLFWDGLKPKINVNVSGDLLNLKKVFNLFGINNYKDYFIISEQEFKKSNDRSVWKDFDVSLKKIIDVNLKILGNINNVKHGAINLNSLHVDLNGNDNLIKVNNISSQINNSVINVVGNLDVNSQIMVGVLVAKNLNFNDFKETKDDKPIFMSMSGKFATNGNSFQKIIANLSAKFNYLLYSMPVRNLDVNLFVNNLHKITDYPSLVSLSERSVVSGETILNEIKGDIDVKNEMMKNNFQFSSNRFTGAGILNTLTSSMSFKGVSRIAFIPYQYNGTVYADIDWSGNLFNVNKAFNVENLRKIVSR